MQAIKTVGLVKRYKDVTAVDGLDLEIPGGEIFALLGVNGAGKTSLFRILTGEYTPDSGAVYVQKGHTVGILEQNPDLSSLPGETTCLEYMYTAFPSLLSLEKRIADLEHELLVTEDGVEILSR